MAPHSLHDLSVVGFLGKIGPQGPASATILQTLIDQPLDGLGYYRARRCEVAGAPCTLARTGYTGEDGFEILAPAGELGPLWGQLLEVGRSSGLVPAGLGARDTLRLEAAMPLYGHELSREGTPLEAGLGKFVALEQEFIGKAALAEASRRTGGRRLIGLEVEGRRIPRQGATLHRDGAALGVVTSGTHSPTLSKTIALAYVESEAPVGSACEVDVRGKLTGARVVALPFYRREK